MSAWGKSSNLTVTTTVIVVLSVWASLQTQLLQLQCWFSCPSEPLFKPNCYNYNGCCPVRLSQFSKPTVTTTVLVVLSVWASLPTHLLQLQCLLSCLSEPVFQTNCYNYRACCPVRLSQSSNPTVTTTELVVLSVWVNLQTQPLQLQCLLTYPSEPVFKPNCYYYSACYPVRRSQSSNPTVTTTELVVLSVWASLPIQLWQLQCLLSWLFNPVFKPNCYNYSAGCPVHLSKTQLLQLQCWLSCPSEPVFKPSCYKYNTCYPVRLSHTSNPTVITTVLAVLSVWNNLQNQRL